MTHREQDVLHSIVESYIETGEPVASRTISKQRGEDLSAATIRNVMADLYENGYLSQPHTSAGRIPTEKAFRSYVQSLARGRVLVTELQRVRAELSQLTTMEARVERSSHMLTEMTQSVGITAAIPASSQTLHQIELIALADQRVLMIVVTRDRMVRNRVVTLEEPASPDDLASIRNYVNRNFSGWQLGAARRELLRRMLEEREMYDEVMRKLQTLYRQGLLEVDT